MHEECKKRGDSGIIPGLSVIFPKGRAGALRILGSVCWWVPGLGVVDPCCLLCPSPGPLSSVPLTECSDAPAGGLSLAPGPGSILGIESCGKSQPYPPPGALRTKPNALETPHAHGCAAPVKFPCLPVSFAINQPQGFTHLLCPLEYRISPRLLLLHLPCACLVPALRLLATSTRQNPAPSPSLLDDFFIP